MTTLRLTENPIELLPITKERPLITSYNKFISIGFGLAWLVGSLSFLLIIPLAHGSLSPLVLFIPCAIILASLIIAIYGLNMQGGLTDEAFVEYSEWANAQQDINVANITAWAKTEAGIELSEEAAYTLLLGREAVTLLNGDEVILKRAVDNKDYLFRVLPIPVIVTT